MGNCAGSKTCEKKTNTFTISTEQPKRWSRKKPNEWTQWRKKIAEKRRQYQTPSEFYAYSKIVDSFFTLADNSFRKCFRFRFHPKPSCPCVWWNAQLFCFTVCFTWHPQFIYLTIFYADADSSLCSSNFVALLIHNFFTALLMVNILLLCSLLSRVLFLFVYTFVNTMFSFYIDELLYACERYVLFFSCASFLLQAIWSFQLLRSTLLWSVFYVNIPCLQSLRSTCVFVCFCTRAFFLAFCRCCCCWTWNVFSPVFFNTLVDGMLLATHFSLNLSPFFLLASFFNRVHSLSLVRLLFGYS